MQKFLDENGLDMIINTRDGLPNGVEQSKYELSILTVSNFANRNNKGCILKINKNLEVIPQIIKANQSVSQGKNIQWVNEN